MVYSNLHARVYLSLIDFESSVCIVIDQNSYNPMILLAVNILCGEQKINIGIGVEAFFTA